MKHSTIIALLVLFLTHITGLPVGGAGRAAKNIANLKNAVKATTHLRKVYDENGVLKHVDANIDPAKAPETVENLKDYVRKHGPEGLTAKAAHFNTPEQANVMREDAIAKLRKPGHEIDEKPAAFMRKPGDPYTTKAIDMTKNEGNREQLHCLCVLIER